MLSFGDAEVAATSSPPLQQSDRSRSTAELNSSSAMWQVSVCFSPESERQAAAFCACAHVQPDSLGLHFGWQVCRWKRRRSMFEARVFLSMLDITISTGVRKWLALQAGHSPPGHHLHDCFHLLLMTFITNSVIVSTIIIR